MDFCLDCGSRVQQCDCEDGPLLDDEQPTMEFLSPGAKSVLGLKSEEELESERLAEAIRRGWTGGI